MPELTPQLVWACNLHGIVLMLPVLAYAQRCAAGGSELRATDALMLAALICGTGLGTVGSIVLDKELWITRVTVVVVRLCMGMFTWGFAGTAVLTEIDPERMWQGSVFVPVVIFSVLCLRVANGLLAACGSVLSFLATTTLFIVYALLLPTGTPVPPLQHFSCNSSSGGFLVFAFACSAFFGVSACADFHACGDAKGTAWRSAAIARCGAAWVGGTGMLACMRVSDFLFHVQHVNENFTRSLSGLEYALLALLGAAGMAECCGMSHSLWGALLTQQSMICGEPPQWAEKIFWAQRENAPPLVHALEKRMRDFNARVRFVGVFEAAAMIVCAAGFFALVALSDRYAFEWLCYLVITGLVAATLGLLVQTRAPGTYTERKHDDSAGDDVVDAAARTGAHWLRVRAGQSVVPDRRSRLPGFRV